MSQDTVLSLEEALARIDHDGDVFQAMAKLFVDQGPKDLAEIKMALVVEDAAALARSAHRLKGAILQFCAPAALAATTEVEGMAKVGNITCAVEACAKLDTELHRLLAMLRLMLNQGQGPSA